MGSILCMLTLLTLTMAIGSRNNLRNLIRHTRIDRIDHVLLRSILAISIIRLAVLIQAIAICKWKRASNILRVILRCLFRAILAAGSSSLGSRNIAILWRRQSMRQMVYCRFCCVVSLTTLLSSLVWTTLDTLLSFLSSGIDTRFSNTILDAARTGSSFIALLAGLLAIG